MLVHDNGDLKAMFVCWYGNSDNFYLFYIGGADFVSRMVLERWVIGTAQWTRREEEDQ